MSTILIQDSLRQTIEACSFGKQTVIYTAKGQPCIMNVIEKKTLAELGLPGAGVHPAFIVDGKEVPKLLIGTYQSTIIEGELLSIPNTEPTGMAAMQGDNLSKLNGEGFHSITAMEYNLVSRIAFMQGEMPMGNVDSGGDPRDGSKGRLIPGTSYTYGGSGPLNWRIGSEFTGISDFIGNKWTWVSGVRLIGGELQVMASNNAATATDHSELSSAWRAIDAVTGMLKLPTYSGTIGQSDYTATTENSIRMRVGATGPTTITLPYEQLSLTTMTFGASITQAAKEVLQFYGLTQPKDYSTVPYLMESIALIPDTNIWMPVRFRRGGHSTAGMWATPWSYYARELYTKEDNTCGHRLAYIPKQI